MATTHTGVTTQTEPLGPPTRFLTLRDCRLPYWRISTGPDIVFIHGWPLDARTWRHSVRALSAHYTCHLFDLPRARRSEWSDETRVGVEEFAAVVAEAIGAMEIDGETFGLVGHNTGGSYLRIAAVSMSERVAGIALGNTEIPGRPSLRLRLLFALGRLRSLEALLAGVLSSRLGRALLSVVAHRNRSLLHGALADLFFRHLAEDDRAMAGAAAVLRSIEVADFDRVAAAHEAITAPVRLIWGRHDPWFPLRDARAMAATFRGSTDLVVLDRAKLFVHEERPSAFNDALRDHFDRCFAVS